MKIFNFVNKVKSKTLQFSFFHRARLKLLAKDFSLK